MTDLHPFLESAEVPGIETANRKIAGPQPPTEAAGFLRELGRSEPASMTFDQFPVVWERARGHSVWDRWGNRWIDFTSGIFAANTGHGHPRVTAAIRAQVESGVLHSYLFPTKARADFVRKLASMAPEGLDKVLLLSTGSEAVECALKMARLRGRKRSPSKLKMICWTNAFHGKTAGAQAMGGRPGAKAWLGAPDPNIHHLPFPYPWDPDAGLSGRERFEGDMDALLATGIQAEDVAAFTLETFQGWAALFYPEGYVAAVREWADLHDAVLFFDEMQAGFGRTGRLFGFEHYGVRPDGLCCGKGLGSGVPLSAVLARSELMDGEPSLNSTHAGNPLCAAAGLATLEVLETEKLAERAARLGPRVGERLDKIRDRFPDRIAHVFGKGLIWALLFKGAGPGLWDAAAADRVARTAVRKGLLLVRTGIGSVKIGPPLTIDEAALDEGLDALEEAVAEAMDGRG